MNQRTQAIQAAWDLRHTNPSGARAIIATIRILEKTKRFDSKNTCENYDAIWGAMYPDDPQGWEYPGQLIRHVRTVVRERDEAVWQYESSSR